ncbi:collagen-like protein, partial [Lactococcus lactis]|nr:collagen-like protein [Lactococcus lactis]
MIKGDKGDTGNDGRAGKDGVGLKNTTVTYGISDNENIQPSNWSSQPPSLVKGKYLWTKTVWTYTDNNTETGYQKTYIAKDGNNGHDGIAGKDGVGIRRTTITYASGTSGTEAPTSGWNSQVQNVPAGQYLWTKTVWDYTDNTNETGYSVSKIGERGPKGNDGERGLQGEKGEQGIPGSKGADGKTQYTHIAY